MAQDQAFNASNAGDTTAGASSEAHQLLEGFWPKVVEDIKTLVPNDFKTQELPLARIKKIMKLDDDVKSMMISAEAPVLFAKAAEMFITELSLRAWIHTEDNKRRTLQRNDIAMAITKYDQFDFLIDIVPRDELTKPPSSKRSNSNNAGLNLTDLATGAQIPADQLQYVVQSPFQSPGVPGQIQVIQTAQGLQLVTPQGAFPGGQQLLQLQVPSNAGGDTGGPTTNLNLQYQIVGPNGEVSQVPLNQLHQLMKIPGQQGIGNQQILIQTPGNPSSFQLAPQGSQPFIGQPSQESSSDPTVEEQD